MSVDREQGQAEIRPSKWLHRSDSGLSFGQQRLLFMDQLNPDSAEYLVSQCFRLRGRLVPEAIRQGLLTVVRRHEVLRSTFAFDAHGEPAVTINDASESVTFDHVNWSARDTVTRERLMRERMTEPMNLATGPLIRVLLARLDHDDHLLLLVVHHIVIDEWSWEIFAEEFSEGYRAHLDQRPSDLPALSLQYRDYAAWQRRTVDHDQTISTELDYWRNQLTDLDTLALPTDFPRPTLRTGAGAAHSFTITTDLANKVSDVFKANRVSPFIGFLAIFKLLIAKYGNHLDIGVGTPISTRVDTRFEPIIGFFLNTLVIRTQLAPDLTVRELLSRVRDQSLAAYDHSVAPFEMLVETLSPDRDLSKSPLFQALFVYERESSHKWQLPHVESERHDLPPFTCWTDLALTVSAREEGMKCTLEYSTDLFGINTVIRMARHFRNLVAAIGAAASEDPLAEISMLDRNEQIEIVRRGWGQRVVTEKNRTILQQFNDHVVEQPDAIAIKFRDTEVTYSELDASSLTLASYLASRGVRKGTVVGLCVTRSADLIVAMLAVLRSGACYVPLNPSHPPERLRLVLDDCAITQIVTDDVGAAALPLDKETDAIGVRVAPAVRSEQARGGLPTVDAGDLAYVVYTSGSTGTPKGVEIEHRALANVSDHFAALLGVDNETTILALTAVTFDIAVIELLMPLAHGATIAMCADETATDSQMLSHALRTMNPSVIQATPSGWRFLINQESKVLSRTTALCGGEVLDCDLAAAITARCRQLFNVYGPSETTVWSTAADTTAGEPSIGRPIRNTDVLVVDPFGALTPEGIPGELWIGGTGLARGYRGRPDLTAQRFVGQRLVEPGGRVYRTGDLVRWDGDFLTFLGRIDDQVKIHGHRVEPAEVEAVLSKHKSVSAAVVVARKVGDDLRLVGYCVPRAKRPGSTLDLREIGDWCSRFLPNWMVPRLVVIDELPLTANGKANRHALPAPSQDVRAAPFAPPRTSLERSLISIWQDALKHTPIGVEDDFFELGGHSLSALRTANNIVSELGIRCDVSEVFECRTVAELARHLSQRNENTLPPIISGDNGGLSFEVADTAERHGVNSDGATPFEAQAVEELTQRLKTKEWSDE